MNQLAIQRAGTAAGAVFVAFGGLSCGQAADPLPFQHVVLISLDTTRADHLSCYDDSRGPITPRIDALSRSGVLFEQVLAPAPTTLASHTSMMTGTYPQTHGVVRNGFLVHPDNVMLAEILAQRGFHTAAFLGSFALDACFDFDQGFEWFDREFDVLVGGDLEAGHDQNQRSAERVTDAVLAHVDRADEDHLFLFAHYFDAHQPYDPPAEFAQRFTEPGAPQRASAAAFGASVAAHAKALVGRGLSPADVINGGLPPKLILEASGTPLPAAPAERRPVADVQLADLYAAEVASVDAQIARLLDGLAERGVLEGALVVITGDHGETFWEHGDTWNHGLWVYETTVHVPLIVRFPDGRGAGTRVSTPVSTIDLVPTLCELFEIELPPRVEGTSLVPAIDGRPFQRGPVFSQATQPGWRFEPRDGAWGNAWKPRCVRDGRWKYVQAPYLARVTSPNEWFGRPGLEQLFDLENDPEERVNLLAPGSELSAEAGRALGGLRGVTQDWVRSARPLPSGFNSEQAEEITARLQQLGYAGQDDDDDEPEPEEDPDEGK